MATTSPYELRDPARDSAAPLPPLAGRDAGAGQAAPPTLRRSALLVAGPLFALTWACFAALVTWRSSVSAPGDLTGLGHLLAGSAAVLALVLVTLAVARRQVSGVWPAPILLFLVAAGVGQARVAFVLAGAGSARLWAPAAHVFELIGFAVPLIWVAADFQDGVRRQRNERADSLVAARGDHLRHQARQTVQAVQRHEVRSMLFAVDGAARALADESLSMSEADRVAFGRMVVEGAERLAGLMEVAPEEVQPFAVDGVGRAVVHAERKAGRTATSQVPAGLRAVGRAADVAGVLRALVGAVAAEMPAGGTRSSGAGPAVALRAEAVGSVVVLRVEPAGGTDLPLDTATWRPVQLEATDPEAGVDLYVAARLLADQGGDLWSAAGPRFVVRLPAANDR
ncbi:MAG TPA: hypothetical protein VGF00_17160 [Acidimicrobiia bacterium]